jgi:hypothetical protein
MAKKVPPEENHYRRSLARLEDLEWILETDNNVNSAIKRAGFTSCVAAAHFCERQRRYDLADKIRFYSMNLGPYQGKAEEFFYAGKDR